VAKPDVDPNRFGIYDRFGEVTLCARLVPELELASYYLGEILKVQIALEIVFGI
jgi:hypothetical protein